MRASRSGPECAQQLRLIELKQSTNEGRVDRKKKKHGSSRAAKHSPPPALALCVSSRRRSGGLVDERRTAPTILDWNGSYQRACKQTIHNNTTARKEQHKSSKPAAKPAPSVFGRTQQARLLHLIDAPLSTDWSFECTLIHVHTKSNHQIQNPFDRRHGVLASARALGSDF